ncbi:hypothetical protein H3S94_11670, partial [Bartonella sp. B10834G3]|nr:hypothetical protein [Bartonella sp. B10834G3]
PLSKQLDPDAVGDMRTLAGSRYDLVDRNNDIVLEYKKNEFIKLYMVGGITGFYNETYSLGISVKSKNDVASVSVMAAALIAAGGKIVQGSGVSDYSVVLPPYQWGGNNDYVVNAVATDVKGNTSKEATTTVTVKAPGFDSTNSTFEADPPSIVADNTAYSTLTFTAKDKNGNPIMGIKDRLVFDVVSKGGSAPDKGKVTLTSIVETKSGVYTAKLKGTVADVYTVTPKFDGKAVGNLSADVTLTAGAPVEKGIELSTFTAVPDLIIADNEDASTLLFTAKDKNGNMVTGIKSRLVFDVAIKNGPVPESGKVTVHEINETKTGVYEATLTGTLANVYTITPKFDGNAVGTLSADVTLRAGDPAEKGERGEKRSTFEAFPHLIVADNNATSLLTFMAQDKYGNAVVRKAKDLKFVMKSGPNSGGITIDDVVETATAGTYTAKLRGTVVGIYTIVPEYKNKAVGSLSDTVTLGAGAPVDKDGDGNPRSTFTAVPASIVADNNTTSLLTFKAQDKNGHVVGGIAKDLKFVMKSGPNSGGITIDEVKETATAGTYTANLKGTVVGVYTIVPEFKNDAVGSLSADVELKVGDPADKGEKGEPRSTFKADPHWIVADNTAYSTLTFMAQDKYGHVISGIAEDLKFVMKSGPNSGGITIDKVKETAIAGTYTANLKGTVVGIYTIVPEFKNAAVGSLSDTVTLGAGAPVDKDEKGKQRSTFTAVPASIVADNNATSLLTFMAQDKNGHVVGGIAKDLKFVMKSGPDSKGITIDDVVETATAGTYTANLKGTVVGIYTIVPEYKNAAVGSLSADVTLTAGDPVDKDGDGNARSTFIADPHWIVADNTAYSTLTFMAQDKYGNAVVGKANDLKFVMKSGPDSKGITIDDVVETATAGTYTANLKGTVVGDYKIVPEYKNKAVGSLSDTVTLGADAPVDKDEKGKQRSTFTAVPASIVADNNATSLLTFKAQDKNGHVVGGIAKDLKFVMKSGPNSGGITIDDVVETETAGTYTANLKGTVVGVYTIVPEYKNAAVGSLSADVELTAGDPAEKGDNDEKRSTFTAFPPSIAADNTATSLLTFMAQDKYGNAVIGKAKDLKFVMKTGPNSGGITIDDVVETATAGTYTAKLKGTVVGVYTIVPQYNNKAVGSLSADVELKIGDPVEKGDNDEKRSTFTAFPHSIVADNNATSLLTFMAQDKNGHVVGGIAKDLKFVMKSGPNSGGITIDDVVETETAGTYTANLKGTVVGVYTIVPEYKNAAVGSLSADVELTAGDPAEKGDNDEKRSTFTAFPHSIVADNNATSLLTFMAQDKYGNAVIGKAKDLKFVMKSGPNSGGITIDDVVETATAGTYTANLKGTVVGDYKIVPEYKNKAVGSLSDTVTLGAGDPVEKGDNDEQRSTFTAFPPSIVADNNATSLLTFKAQDKNGHVVGGIAKDLKFVMKSGPNSGGITIDDVVETETAGTYTANLKGTVVGIYTIVPEYNNKAVGSLSADVTLKVGDPADKGEKGEPRSTFKADPHLIVADNTAYSTLTFMAQDKYGHVISGIAEDLKFVMKSGPDSGGITIDDVVETATAGTYTANLKGTVVGDYKIVPEYKNKAVGSLSDTVTLGAGDPVEKGDNDEKRSTFTAFPPSIVADNNATSLLTFMAQDKNGHVVGGIAKDLKFVMKSGPDSKGITIDDVVETETAGTYTANLKGTVVGVYTIVPEYKNAAVGSLSADVELTAGDPAEKGDNDEKRSTFTAFPPSIAADNTATSLLTFMAQDKYGNAVVGKAGNLKFVMKSGPDSKGITIDDVVETATAGTYTAKLKGTVVGVYTIVPQYNNKAVGSLSADVELKIGDPVDKDDDGKPRSTFTAVPDSIVADNNATSLLTFMAQDKTGHVVGGIAKDLKFVMKSGPNSKGITIDDVVETETAGTYTANLKGTVAGIYTIVPEYKNAAVGSLSANVTLKAGDPAEKGDNDEKRSTFEAVPDLIVADGHDTSTLTFTAKDKYGNLVGNIAENLKFVMKNGPNSGSITIDDVVETGTGIYTAKLKGTVTGVYTIVPEYNNKAVGSLSADVTLSEFELVLAWENDKTSATVDEQPTFTVAVRDKNTGQLIPNKTVTFTLSSNGGGRPSIYPATVKSDADGQITQAPAVSDHTPETVTVTGQISGTTVTASLNITFTAGKVNVNTSTIYADPDTIVADGKTTSTIHYKPKDGYGNPITSIDASTITSKIIGITDSGITISSWSFVDGHYQAVLTSGTKIGAIKVIPVINGEDGISRSTGNILTLISGGIDVSKGEIKAIPNRIVANGRSTSRIEFRPRDAAGNFIATLKTETISQVITPQEANGPQDTKMSAWSYDRGAGAYVSTLTSGTTIGVINIMPTVNGLDAATIGVTKTLELIEIPGQNININIAHTDTAIADGDATNVVTITLTDDNGAALANRTVTVTPTNLELELAINGVEGSVDVVTDEDGKVSVQMSSTYASWLGSNGFMVSAEGFTAQGETNFSLYVDQENSLISLDKDIIYNDGIDRLTATYKPVDKKGRAIPAELLPVTFSTTDLGATQVITQNGLVATVSSKSSPSTYQLSVKMTNYSQGWQPESVEYKLRPASGVLLAILDVSPKLCGTTTNGIANGMPYTYCTPTDGVDYYHSGLGFVIELIDASPLWDKQLTLHSSTVDGAIYVQSKDGTKRQNCSVPVSIPQSWMNDYGDRNNNLDLSFTKETIIDTYDKPGYLTPTTGGGIGACDYYSSPKYVPLKPDLQGSGNVEFEAYTKNPKSTTSFKVPLTGKRMDVGELSSIRVFIYAD